MDPEVEKCIITCLRENADVFDFTPFDLKGIYPAIAIHILHEDPSVEPFKQKLRSGKAVGSKAYSGSAIPPLAVKCGNGRKMGMKVADVHRLLRPQPGVPQRPLSSTSDRPIGGFYLWL